MKVSLKIFFYLIVFLFSIVDVIAKATPPQPPPTGRMAATNDLPPPPPGLSIDRGLVFLLLIALLYGIYVIYSFRKKLKASV
jgi:hypothetical protein